MTSLASWPRPVARPKLTIYGKSSDQTACTQWFTDTCGSLVEEEVMVGNPAVAAMVLVEELARILALMPDKSRRPAARHIATYLPSRVEEQHKRAVAEMKAAQEGRR